MSDNERSIDKIQILHPGINADNLDAKEFFQFLPGAKEAVELIIADWIKAQRLMLWRLVRDRRSLSPVISPESIEQVSRLTPGFSDPHDRGQTVTILQFAGGRRVVYKPRTCEGEQIWFAALRWLNDCGFQPAFYIPQIVSRGKYCWMSFVRNRACNSDEAIRRFYFRWGAQAAIAQLLGCADLHRQNWIAAGEHPVLVDADMLGDGFVTHDAGDRLAQLHPLLRTGLLPIFESDGAGRYNGIAPLDSTETRNEKNVFWPTCNGRTKKPLKYVDQIVDGFLAAARFVCDRHNRKGFERFVRQAAQRKNLRVLKRATSEYRQILLQSLHPNHLRTPSDRLKYLLDRCGRDRAGVVEVRSLLRCSIPRFTGRAARRRAQITFPSLRAMLDSTKLLRLRL